MKQKKKKKKNENGTKKKTHEETLPRMRLAVTHEDDSDLRGRDSP